MAKILVNPLTPYWVYMALLTILFGWVGTQGAPLPWVIEEFWGLIGLILIFMWMERDAARFRRTPFFDFGWLSSLGWPVMIPRYCFQTRRWKGVLLFLGMVAAFMAPIFSWSFLFR